MPYTICNIDRFVLSSRTNEMIGGGTYQSRRYDFPYMVERYGVNPDSFVPWLMKQMNLTGNEVALELGCFSDSYWIHNLEYAHSFKKLYLVDMCVDRILHTKRLLKRQSEATIELNQSENLTIEAKSVDVIYVCHHEADRKRNKPEVMLEMMRVLKDNGSFYYTMIVEDYAASIYRLLEEFDSKLSFENEMRSKVPAEYKAQKVLAMSFLNTEESEFQSQLFIDNVDDLIGFILTADEFKTLAPMIFKTGLSKFRTFLQERIETLGGISLTRRISVVKCSGKRIYS